MAEKCEVFLATSRTSQKCILSNTFGEGSELIDVVMKATEAVSSFNSCTVLP